MTSDWWRLRIRRAFVSVRESWLVSGDSQRSVSFIRGTRVFMSQKLIDRCCFQQFAISFYVLDVITTRKVFFCFLCGQGNYLGCKNRTTVALIIYWAGKSDVTGNDYSLTPCFFWIFQTAYIELYLKLQWDSVTMTISLSCSPLTKVWNYKTDW